MDRSVYRNPDNGLNRFEQLETVVLSGFADVGYDRVYLAVQHPFAALLSRRTEASCSRFFITTLGRRIRI